MVFLDLTLEEMARVLAPGGTALVGVPSVDTVFVRLARRLSSAHRFTRPGFDHDRASELEHGNAIWQVEKAFRRHFRVAERFPFPFRAPLLSASLIATYVLTAR